MADEFGGIALSIDEAGRDVLPSMEVQIPGRRNADGTVSCLHLPPFRSMMFGPFLRLKAGRYYLEIEAVPGTPLQRGQPIFGVEVIAQNRILRGWRDFTPAELTERPQRIYFDVPFHLGIEGGADVPFEFRFTSFGTSAFKVVRLVLVHTPGAPVPEVPAMQWRLLGRLRLFPLSGGVVISPLSVGFLKFGRPWASLYLPAGLCKVELGLTLLKLKDPVRETLEIRVVTQEGMSVCSEVFNGKDLLGGNASLLFEMPADISYDAGSPHRLHVEVRQFGNATLRIEKLNIHRVDALATEPTRPISRPSLKIAGNKKRIIIFGNCQGGILANVLRHHSAFSGQFLVKHHSMELPANLHEQGKRDLEQCDILLVQDIREWEQYPLRDYVPETVKQLRYPCVRFASPWPFDAFNGPDDRFARNKDYPNFEFTYFDGLLGRLRNEIPDQEMRFEAYRSLSLKGSIDPKRLHVFEEKRLQAMDEKFDIGIGAFILDNFRKHPVFYTTAHPNGPILRMLLKYIARELGVQRFIWPTRRLDALRNLQIPVHPLVAHKLELKWANETTLYRLQGKKVTWEDYVRKYISYYG
ncbi:WcbI family polysaccharide biosynthesis putative acetyltransferase [Rhizobium sp. FY34]|uniref:WcbI family polysaccharide biosynthesis putative acetyltransferase n=1 Tax=Rhizobium sp. FY34 TaxID=2562309 RepID=UPI0010C02E8B|nr:WcbI family polysaccharide biosynthesis putative acetyltransferase [Rhizobium sp. FY34]